MNMAALEELLRFWVAFSVVDEDGLGTVSVEDLKVSRFLACLKCLVISLPSFLSSSVGPRSGGLPKQMAHKELSCEISTSDFLPLALFQPALLSDKTTTRKTEHSQSSAFGMGTASMSSLHV